MKTEELASATHQRSSIFSSQWGVVPNNFVRKMTHDQILKGLMSLSTWPNPSWRLDCWDRGLGALLVEKFLKAHGALYEQKAHRLFCFLFLEGWNRWWWIFFKWIPRHVHSRKKTTRKCLRLGGDVQETKMVLIDSFEMSLKDGNDGIHYIWSVTKIFRFNEFS